MFGRYGFEIFSKEDANGKIIEIEAALVEGDHVYNRQTFTGETCIMDLREWRSKQTSYEGCTSFWADDFTDERKIEKIRWMLFG